MSIPTLLFAALTVQVCSALCLLLISRRIAGLDGLHWYGWGYLAMAGGLGMAVLGDGFHMDLVPVHVTAWLLPAGRTLVLAGAVLLTQGVSDFVVPGSNALTSGGVFVAVVALGEFALWGWIEHPELAVMVACGAVMAQLSLTALLLFSHRHPAEAAATRTSAMLLAAMALLLAFRVVLMLLQVAPVGLLTSNPVRVLGILLYLVFSLGLAFGFVWMAIARVRNQLEVQARTDALTGLLNRRALEQAGEREVAGCRLRQAPLTLLALDLDHFKLLNDRYGHAGGDAVLVATAQLLGQGLRSTDLVGRQGGEEFAVVLPERDAQRGMEIAERLRARLEELEVVYEGERIPVRASLGVAELLDGDSWGALLRRADLALYRAKRSGRNRVYLASRSEHDLAAAPQRTPSAKPARVHG